MKKIYSILFVGLLALMVILSGCSKTELLASNIDKESVPKEPKVVVKEETISISLNEETATKEKVADEQITEIMEKKEEPIVTEPEVKEFNIQMKKWEFIPSEIKVKKGDKVKFVVSNLDAAHGLKLPEFSLDLKPAVGETATAEFVADKVGSFTFSCHVFCGSGHGGMKGTFIVEE